MSEMNKYDKKVAIDANVLLSLLEKQAYAVYAARQFVQTRIKGRPSVTLEQFIEDCEDAIAPHGISEDMWRVVYGTVREEYDCQLDDDGCITLR